MLRTTMCTLLAATIAVGQKTSADKAPTAREFVFSGYENTIFADLKAMRDREIWDELEATALKFAFGMIEKDLGFPLDDLDRFTVAVQMPPNDVDGIESVKQQGQVYIYEGNKLLPVPDKVSGGGWTKEKVGERQVMARNGFVGEELWLQPHPNVQVTGTRRLLEPILTKPRHVGMPAAELMSLLSGREERLLYLVVCLEHPRMKQQIFTDLLGAPEWAEGEAPRYLGFSVLAGGDEDDPHLFAEAVLRHVRVSDGIEVSSQAADAWVERMLADPRYLGMRAVLKKAEKKVDGTDVMLHVDLGRVRNAVGQLATLAVPLFRGMGGPVRREMDKAAGGDKKK